MARPKCATPSYCQHKRSGRAYVTIDGRQHQLPGPHGSAESRAAYDRLVSEWLANGRTLETPTRGGATINMVALRFWKYAQATYVHADGTPTGEAENYRQVIRALRLAYGSTPAVEFGPKRLKEFRATLIRPHDDTDPETGKTITRPGWSRTYTNRQIKRVVSLFRWAASEELIPATVPAQLATVDGLRRGRDGARETEPVRAVADELVDATLDHLPPPVRAMVQLQRLSGARGGELFVLRPCDIRMDGDVWEYRPVSHKTAHHGHERVIYFGPQAQDILRPFIRPDVGGYVFRPADGDAWRNERLAKARPTKVQPSQQARKATARAVTYDPKYDKGTYAQAIKRACAKAFPPPSELARAYVRFIKSDGRPYTRPETPAEWRTRLGDEKWAALLAWRRQHSWHPHQLRHTAATNFRQRADFEAAKILLGHKTDRMTQQYAERDAAKAREVIARVG